jgi:sn-glycerol 3-phosphate transport system substrate-binding protein
VPIGTKSNGFDGLDTELVFNKDPVLRHITNMAEWQKSKIFDYGGRRSDMAPKFYTQECAIYMNSSGSYAGVKANAKFAFGVGQLPYYPDVKGAPQNSIIGGATLWVLNGRPAADYKGVGEFFKYLSRTEVQADWHQSTGYLPITYAAYEATKKSGFYDKNPGTDVAIKQLTGKEPTKNSRGLRFGNFVQIRDTINQELEAVWAGKTSAKDALDEAVKRGNALLRRFEAANK